MVVVDSHLHVNFYGFSPDDIIQYLDNNRIDFCWLLTWEEINPGPWSYQHLSIDDVYDAYLKYQSRIIPFYAPDPHSDDASSKLESWFQKGIRGCGELKSTLNWGSSNVRKLLSTVEKLGMPLVFHMEESEQRTKPDSSETYTFPGYLLDLASLEVALKDYPSVNFIAHGPTFWKNISADANSCTDKFPKGPIVGEGVIWRLLRDYRNLHADISANSGAAALTRDPENARRFLSLFEDKILYGTDNMMMGQRDFLDSLKLAPQTYEKIYGKNACQLINV